MDDKIIGSIQKNALEKIVVANRTFKERNFTDIRIFYQNEIGEDYKPTKKGVTIAPDKLEGLIALLKKAQKPL